MAYLLQFCGLSDPLQLFYLEQRSSTGAEGHSEGPAFGGFRPFQLDDLRHPLLLWQERREGGAAVVPVSVRVEGGLRVVAITGPNTGGKTVTLKSVGLAVLMARAGLFVPCGGSPRLPWCRQVLADIGDEQSLQQNLSTFSGHVRRIARILEALPPPAPPQLVYIKQEELICRLETNKLESLLIDLNKLI